MKTICLYFEIHQITHLKRYRFFDIGTDHYYYDDYENDRSINEIAERSYMSALNALQEMIEKNGKGMDIPVVYLDTVGQDFSTSTLLGDNGWCAALHSFQR